MIPGSMTPVVTGVWLVLASYIAKVATVAHKSRMYVLGGGVDGQLQPVQPMDKPAIRIETHCS